MTHEEALKLANTIACKAAYVHQLCKEHPMVPHSLVERAKYLAADLDVIATDIGHAMLATRSAAPTHGKEGL